MNAPAHIRFEDLSDLDTVPAALALHRAMSSATDEHELLAAVADGLSRVSGATHSMNLVLKDLPPGSYRIASRITHGTETSQTEGPGPGLDDDADAPVRTSPVLSRLCAADGPVLARRLNPEDDDALAGWIDGPRDAISVPVFERGRPDRRAVLFFPPSDDEIKPRELAVGIGNVNLMHRGFQQLAQSRRLAAMHAELDDQLKQVGDLQRALLPSEPPDDPRVTVAAGYRPCDHAGGDYYDHGVFPDGTIRFLVADVAGHGAKAAVAMTVVRTVVAAAKLADRPPENIGENINQILLESLDDGMFVTAFFIALDPATGACQYLNFGHNRPRIRRKDGSIESIGDAGAPPLGVLPTADCPMGAASLAPGDLLVLYTDGITEAFSPKRVMLGDEGLDRVIHAAAGDPHRTRDQIFAAVDAHTASGPRLDDQTLVAVRFEG